MVTIDFHTWIAELLLDELLGMGIVVFAAGYETTALLLTYLSYILATHPEVQDKLLKEVDQHFPSVSRLSYFQNVFTN
jgi:cytochrome P450